MDFAENGQPAMSFSTPPFRPFPELQVKALFVSARHLSARLKHAVNGLHGPLPDGYERVFRANVSSLDHLAELLRVAGDTLDWHIEMTPPVREGPGLSERELDILRYMCAGDSNALIAQKLNYSVGTIKAHVRTILKKLDATDRTQAAVIAVKRGLI